MAIQSIEQLTIEQLNKVNLKKTQSEKLKWLELTCFEYSLWLG